MNLPDFDDIPSLNVQPGMYSRDRWPDLVTQQILFLQAVAEKYGPTARMFMVESYHGYPGYILVRKY